MKKIGRTTGFAVPKLIHVLKESSASSALKADKKCYKFENSYVYLSLRFLLLLNMCFEFLKLTLAHLQNLSFLTQWPGRRGRPPLLSFGVILFVGENAQITAIYG